MSRNFYILYTLAHLKQKANVRGTILGYLWWFIEPLMLIALYSYVVGVIFGHSGADQILMIAIGVTLWKWWSTSLSSATTSFKRYKGIVTQVKMPLPILPISEVVGQTYLFAFGYILLQSILLILGYVPNIPALIIALLSSVLMVSALSLAFSVLNVFIRDTAFLVGFGLRILFYVTPIIYPASRVPESYRWIIDINPFAHLVTLFNESLVHPEQVNYTHSISVLLSSITFLIVMLLISKKLRTSIIRNV